MKSLCEKLHNTHRHIYFDNFFSSVDLALDLVRVGLYSCGTLRSNRKRFPTQLKQFVKKGLPERGQSKTYQCGNLCVSVWQDKRPVTTIATNSDTTIRTLYSKRNVMAPALHILVPAQSPSTTSTWVAWTETISCVHITMFTSRAESTTNTYSGSYLTCP